MGVVNEVVEGDESVSVGEVCHVVDENGSVWIWARIVAEVMSVRYERACLEVVGQWEPVAKCHLRLWS